MYGVRRPIVMGGGVAVVAVRGRKPGGTAEVGRLANGGNRGTRFTKKI
jgi:hypothetical protein